MDEEEVGLGRKSTRKLGEEGSDGNGDLRVDLFVCLELFM